MYRIYHRENAGRPVRLRWALEEAGADYDYVVMTREESRGSQHRERNPLGRVPVLETDDGFLFESAALCLHVADLFPEAGLIPEPGSYERGLVYQWTVWSLSELEPAIVQAFRLRQDGDEAAFAAGQERIAELEAPLEHLLADRNYLVGDRFTIADLVVGSVLHIGRRLEFPLPPILATYLGRLDQRPARQRAYTEPFLQPAPL